MEEVREKKGSRNLIIGGIGSVYKIKQAGNIALPEKPWYRFRNQYRSLCYVNMIWEMCEKNLSGLDPLAKKLKEKFEVKRTVITPLFNHLLQAIPYCVRFVNSERSHYKNDKLILQDLLKNWTRENYKDFPDIVHTESEEDYVLFIKKEKLFPFNCHVLFRLAHHLGIGDYIKCDDCWKGNLNDNPKKPVYLWIRKDKLEEVVKVLELQFESIIS